MTFHPLTHIITAFELALLVQFLPIDTGTVVFVCLLITAVSVPARTDKTLTVPFLKLLFMAALFLFLIHGLRLSPPGIDRDGLYEALRNFLRIGAPVTFVMYLSKRIRSEELFALMIDARVPPILTVILFRTLWLVPRLLERMEEVVTAQKLRGMRIDNVAHRFLAILPTLTPIFSSMITEISENALTLTARGFLRPGRKSHYVKLTCSVGDYILVALTTVIVSFLCY